MSRSMHELVAVDLVKRARVGLAEYGRPLTANNGRDGLWDAYEECLDMACYLRQVIEERRGWGTTTGLPPEQQACRERTEDEADRLG